VAALAIATCCSNRNAIWVFSVENKKNNTHCSFLDIKNVNAIYQNRNKTLTKCLNNKF
jgi:hypothetical protein